MWPPPLKWHGAMSLSLSCGQSLYDQSTNSESGFQRVRLKQILLHEGWISPERMGFTPKVRLWMLSPVDSWYADRPCADANSRGSQDTAVTATTLIGRLAAAGVPHTRNPDAFGHRARFGSFLSIPAVLGISASIPLRFSGPQPLWCLAARLRHRSVRYRN